MIIRFSLVFISIEISEWNFFRYFSTLKLRAANLTSFVSKFLQSFFNRNSPHLIS